MKTKRLTFLDREGLKNYLFEIQDHIDAKVEDGQDIDDFLDNTDIFDEFEEVLPDEEYPVFVITILNKILLLTLSATAPETIPRRNKGIILKPAATPTMKGSPVSS